ncbi:polyprenyl synthetase family protein, partial [Lactobacillus salivarius]|nr:polyprenyl synthetase family protein [Ligilactobacillus salivarius]
MRISNLTEFEKISLPKLENEMDLYLNSLNSNQILKESMRYSVDAGGKRIRP